MLAKDAYQQLTFLWPLDDDLLHILQQRDFGALLDYLQPRTSTNLRTDGMFRSLIKVAHLFRTLMRRSKATS